MVNAVDLIRQTLLTVTDKVYHYQALKQTDSYIVFAEDGQGADSWADNKCGFTTITGTIDLFTKREDDPLMEEIPNALNNGDIYWYLNSVQFEPDTKYKHYEWVWEVPE